MAADLAARRRFQDFVVRALNEQSCAAEADAKALRGEIGELSRRLVALERRLRASGARAAELSAVGRAGAAAPAGQQAAGGAHAGEPRPSGAVEAFAGEQFDGIQALAGVREIATEGACLRIDTEPVAIDWEGRRYALGAFRLTLDLAGDVRVDSLEHLGPKSGWDHPHVQDGLPCLGNLRPGILKLIADFELALAAQLLLDFLATYQPETAYTPIEGWPQA